jgi:Leucine-rich repeat (LRR) protein
VKELKVNKNNQAARPNQSSYQTKNQSIKVLTDDHVVPNKSPFGDQRKIKPQRPRDGAATQRDPFSTLNSLDKFENKLSLRLSNIKVLSPRRLKQPTNLTHVDLRNNRIHELPDEICDLSQLEELKLDYNFLGSLPREVNKLKRLSHLSVS